MTDAILAHSLLAGVWDPKGFSGLPGKFRYPTKTRQHLPSSLAESAACYYSFAYSAFACFRMGMSGSASFQSVVLADHPPRNGPKRFVESVIAMFRQVLQGNGRARLLSCGRECQQNAADDTDDDNIRKIPMNAVLPCLHSLDGHYRSMGQALARGESNQRAVQRRLSGSQQQKGAERDKPTEKHRVALVFLFEKPTR